MENKKTFDPWEWTDDTDGQWYDAATDADIASLESGGPGWVIEDDNVAEWALRKKAEARELHDRLTAGCDYQIEFYSARKKKFDIDLERREAFLNFHLSQYFKTRPHRKTKTTEVYDLPSGKLVLKHNKPKVERDDEALADWCMMNGFDSAVEYQAKVNWAELKKQLKETDKGYVTEMGEIVPGVWLVNQADSFDAEVK